MTKDNFNLIDDKWIPMVGEGLVSLKDVFSKEYCGLGGNPVQKIVITKLLLAIAQAAHTPEDEDEMDSLGVPELAVKCLAYLKGRHDRFYLYGDQPFLQIPEIKTAAIQSYGAVLADVSTGNTTVLTQSQVEKPEEYYTDADKAMLIVQLMGFALGGKKVDNSKGALSQGYQKTCTAKPGPFLGSNGLMHSFLQGRTVRETLWLNLFTKDKVDDMYQRGGVGTAPWDAMPTGENCGVAINLKSNLMGRLIPMSRFCLLTKGGLHYSEGILHPDYKAGGVDPSIFVKRNGANLEAILVDPGKRPWRELTSLLASYSGSNVSFYCPQVRLNRHRSINYTKTKRTITGVWSGGLSVGSNAGEQYVTGLNDFVESITWLNADCIGAPWYANLEREMTELNRISERVHRAATGYFRDQNMDSKCAAAQASLAKGVFWEHCNGHFQVLIDACSIGGIHNMRRTFAQLACASYDTCCPNGTARKMDSWVKNYPTLKKYLNKYLKTMEGV